MSPGPYARDGADARRLIAYRVRRQVDAQARADIRTRVNVARRIAAVAAVGGAALIALALADVAAFVLSRPDPVAVVAAAAAAAVYLVRAFDDGVRRMAHVAYRNAYARRARAAGVNPIPTEDPDL